jgi:hypothetical protein
MANRVDCADCTNFIPPVPKEPGNLISDITKAGCSIKKRVMFRSGGYLGGIDKTGWFRYCDDFNYNNEFK